MLKKARRDIARLKTVIRQRQLQASAQQGEQTE
jgi:ribosomal protein L29